MKIKVSEATPLQLSYLVTMLEMPHLVWGETIGIHHASNQVVVPNLKEPDCYSPYMTWGMCGPIIEREFIELKPGSFIGSKNAPRLWAAWGQNRHGDRRQGKTGLTPLSALLRCYVASKLGDEVEVPEELR